MTSMTPAPADAPIHSLIPARIDRLPWSPFHTRMVLALGTAWVLDGLEITVASAVVAVLDKPEGLNMSATAVGALATVYLLGEVFGALFFGRLSDRMGRRNLFIVTLAIYLGGSALTALTLGNGPGWIAFLYVTRFIAGAGIGGEYAAINSAIDELIPAQYRGRVDIAVNGSYWGGAILGTLGTYILLNQTPNGVGWRLAFLLGPLLGFVIIFVRRNLPESPRWQIMNGRAEEAERSVSFIEREVEATGRTLEPVSQDRSLEIKPSERTGYLTLVRVLFRDYPKRSVLGASLMITQSFLYNAIFFTYTLVLTKFYGVDEKQAPLFLAAFAVGNLIGPLSLGHLFDTIGRKQMIAGTYISSGILLAITATLFNAGVLNAFTMTVCWCVIFFFASAGASAAYLTVSEIFPIEVRAQAIAVFFAIAQTVGAIGPTFYGALIGEGDNPGKLFVGYLIAAGIMIAGGVVEIVLGVAAERQSLEDIANPLSVVRSTKEGVSHLGTSQAGPRRPPGPPSQGGPTGTG
jgi:MFS family permease